MSLSKRKDRSRWLKRSATGIKLQDENENPNEGGQNYLCDRCGQVLATLVQLQFHFEKNCEASSVATTAPLAFSTIASVLIPTCGKPDHASSIEIVFPGQPPSVTRYVAQKSPFWPGYSVLSAPLLPETTLTLSPTSMAIMYFPPEVKGSPCRVAVIKSTKQDTGLLVMYKERNK